MKTTPEITQEAYAFLANNNTAVVSTSFNNEPYSSTVHFESDKSMNLYFLSHRNTHKYINISTQQKVAVVIGTGPKHISIQARGTADMLVGEARDEVLKHFQYLKDSHFIENLPVEEMSVFREKNPIVFKFEPTEMLFMNLDDDHYPLSKGREYYQIF